MKWAEQDRARLYQELLRLLEENAGGYLLPALLVDHIEGTLFRHGLPCPDYVIGQKILDLLSFAQSVEEKLFQGPHAVDKLKFLAYMLSEWVANTINLPENDPEQS